MVRPLTPQFKSNFTDCVSITAHFTLDEPSAVEPVTREEENPTYPPPSVSPHFRFHDADLIIRTPDKVEFWVHKSLMALASRVFRDMVSFDAVTPPTCTAHRDGQIVDVEERSPQMEATLRYIYPLPPPVLRSLSQVAILLEIADKYDIPIIPVALEDLVVSNHFWEHDAIRAYEVSKKFNLRRWQVVIEPVILKIPYGLLRTLPTYDEGDFISADDLRRLEYYRSHRVYKAIALVASDEYRAIHICACRQRNMSDDDDDDEEDSGEAPCVAWMAFQSICGVHLNRDPTLDITSEFLRKEAVEDAASYCDDAERVLHEYYIETIKYLSRRVNALPWVYPKEYEEAKVK